MRAGRWNRSVSRESRPVPTYMYTASPAFGGAHDQNWSLIPTDIQEIVGEERQGCAADAVQLHLYAGGVREVC